MNSEATAVRKRLSATSAPVPPKSTYGQIFRSSATIGVASVINILLNIVRTKCMAVMLGPSGVGTLSAYNSLISVASIVSGMGVRNSGVREIAEAAGSGDQNRIAAIISALRRISMVLGLLGGLGLAALSVSLSHLTFGDSSHAWAIALLGAAVAMGGISGGQAALLQGLRRIGDLARMNVLGALYGTVLGVPLVFLFGERGIVPLILVVAFMAVLTSWWFARKVTLPPVQAALSAAPDVTSRLLRLGLTFMAGAVMTTVVAYVTRVIVLRQLGLEAVGYYSAAYTIAGLYVGFILEAMGADFYPRLTSVAGDNMAVNRMVNEQTEIALLMAVPGVLATLTFAPWVISIFYSGTFDSAVEVLRWQILGVLGRVISWPMGFILLAKGSQRTFLFTETSANILHIGLVIAGVKWVGLVGTGVAFFLLYVFVTILILTVSRSETGFSWSAANRGFLYLFIPAVAVVFALTRIPSIYATILGSLITAGLSLFCLREMLLRLPANRLPLVRKLARNFL